MIRSINKRIYLKTFLTVMLFFSFCIPSSFGEEKPFKTLFRVVDGSSELDRKNSISFELEVCDYKINCGVRLKYRGVELKIPTAMLVEIKTTAQQISYLIGESNSYRTFTSAKSIIFKNNNSNNCQISPTYRELYLYDYKKNYAKKETAELNMIFRSGNCSYKNETATPKSDKANALINQLFAYLFSVVVYKDFNP